MTAKKATVKARGPGERVLRRDVALLFRMAAEWAGGMRGGSDEDDEAESDRAADAYLARCASARDRLRELIRQRFARKK